MEYPSLSLMSQSNVNQLCDCRYFEAAARASISRHVDRQSSSDDRMNSICRRHVFAFPTRFSGNNSFQTVAISIHPSG